MIWTLIKAAVLIGLAMLAAFGANMIMQSEGQVVFRFADETRQVTFIGFILMQIALFAAIILAWWVAGLVVAIIKFFLGDETAFSRFFERGRQKKGINTLSDSLVALAGGDADKASTLAKRADKYLEMPEVTKLLKAQAAEASGKTDQAVEAYKELVTNPKTRFVGVSGLLRQTLENGDTDKALLLAEKAFAIKPAHKPTLDTLFHLQSEKADWSGARKTVQAGVRAGHLPKDIGKRREAVLAMADAQALVEEGKMPEAKAIVAEANKAVPGLIPAAALLAELQIAEGNKAVATKTLKRTWAIAPHPDLASAYAAIEPEETPEARLKRFKALLKSNPSHHETKLLDAELHLAAEDFPGARRALGKLAEEDPTARSMTVMAAIEKGEGAPEAVVRGWLAKAVTAPRDEQWVCTKTGKVHAQWAPVCDGAVDTLEWRRPDAPSSEPTGALAMLPLIIGSLEDKSNEGEHTQDAEIVEDAVKE